MFSLFIFSFFLLFSFPGDAFSFEHKSSAQEMLDFAESIDFAEGVEDELEKKFDDLAALIDESADPIAEAKEFLRVFLEELELRYGVVLTLPQVCELVRNNIDMFGFSTEEKGDLLAAIDLLGEEIK